MEESRNINPETNSVFGNIFSLKDLEKETARSNEVLQNAFKTRFGTEEELKAIKKSECSHIKVKREDKVFCAKCGKEYDQF